MGSFKRLHMSPITQRKQGQNKMTQMEFPKVRIPQSTLRPLYLM